MNGAHLHLIICHIPIIGAGFTILLILFSYLKKSKDLKQTSLWFAAITGISALAVYLTGSSAEGYAMTVPGITEEIIEPHESIALYYMLALCFIGLIALAGLFLSQASIKVLQKFVIVILVLNLMASYLAIKTGLTGGNIRHSVEFSATTPVPDEDD